LVNKTLLNKIRREVQNCKECAENILEGGDNYDGADGARCVLELCDYCQELLDFIEEK